MIIVFLLIQSVFAANHSALRMDQFCLRQANLQLRNLIEKMIEEVKERIKCIVYIADSYYRKIINFGEIKVAHIFPIYQLKIRDSEEFSPPRNRVISILKNSRDAACNLYIFLIANGLQNLQLIQFAEQQRYIDTRGMFILMNDFRLLHPEVQYLWNRMINVIFIRRYSALKRRSGEQTFREWYDLHTIYYPAKIKGLVQTRYIDSFYRGRFRYGVDHFPHKIKNLQHKRLRVAVFQHIPAVTKVAEDFYNDVSRKTAQALGLEFELMKIIAKVINFHPLFYAPDNIKEEKWGNVGENQTNGLLGEAAAGKAAFYLGDLHYTPRHLNIMDLTWPYNFECLTFLTPESLTENSWKLLILPFKLYSWVLVILTLLMGGIIIFLFALFYEKRIILCKIGGPDIEKTKKAIKIINKNKTNPLKEKLDEEMEGLHLFSNPQNSLLYTYSMLLQVSLPMLPKAFAVRVFIGCWWLYTILITVTYRASMTAALANPVARVTIDTVEQLAKTPIIAGSWGYEKKEFFLSSEDPNLQKVGERFEMIGNQEDALARVAKGRFCYYENIFVLREARVSRQVLEAELKKNATERNENVATDRDLHVMEECVINMPVSLGLDKNSPLKPRVDKLVRRSVEVGLLQKWLKDVMEWSKITEMRQENESEKALVNFHKLQGALVALGIGYFFSFLALAGEMLHWKYIVMRNPLFDKYHLDVFYKKN